MDWRLSMLFQEKVNEDDDGKRNKLLRCDLSGV